jgi:large subunit ribosomal protein L24
MQATKPVKNPRKQRKLLYNAPAHLRHKLMSAPLSPQLTASKSVKTLPVHKGDTVSITRGDHKGFEGKISRVDVKNYRIYLEGLTREKVDGTTIFLPVHPSKVMIKNLNLSDKWRKAIVERKESLFKEREKVEKPRKKAVKAEKAAKKPRVEAPKVEEIAEEKPVEEPEKVAEVEAAVEETVAVAKPKAKATAKSAPKKKKETAAKKTPAVKAKKPKAAKPAKKARAKPKAASKTKEGGK